MTTGDDRYGPDPRCAPYGSDMGPEGPRDVTAGVTTAVGQHVAAVSATGVVDAGWHDDAPEVAL